MNRVLVLGANGQLGKSLRFSAEKRDSNLYNIIYSDIEELDITKSTSVKEAIRASRAKIIVNCAAYTAVDQAEEDEERAFLLNEKAVGYMANAAKEENGFLIHISTDYVFDGTANLPYRVDDPVNPVSVYGKSKAAGEKAILDSGCNAAIIRTSWLYSLWGNNFVKSIIRNGKIKEQLNVVNDQFGGPTWAPDLAEAIFALIAKPALHHGVNIWHFANQGVITWYDFAVEIVRLWNLNCKVCPISSDQYPMKTKRPAWSVFDLSKTEHDLGIAIPEWKESLKVMCDLAPEFNN